MCGFIGHLSKNNISQEKLELANNKIICRGPDSCKKLQFENNNFNFSFIFNRLRIIDLSNLADQPMWSESKKSIIMFNGEIYNHKSLREDLIKKGIKFKTIKSDTETVLKGLDFYGKEFIKKLRGQFSIFYLNLENSSCLLTRDRLGQKPLYYKIANDKVSFSSNLKSLVEFEGNIKLCKDQIIKYLKYGAIPSPNTIFKNVYKVKPSEIIEIFLNSNEIKVSKSVYWMIKEHIDNKKFTNDDFFELFSESVQIRQEADVEIGNFLSGGIDSTSIVKNMYDNNLKINSFSVNVKNPKYDESKWSGLVSEKYNTNHISIDIDSNLSFDYFTTPLKSLDEPYSDPSVVPSFYLSKEISKYFKVAISGDGGDELLGGYKRVQYTMKKFGYFNNLFSNFYNIYPAKFGTGNYFLSKNSDLGVRYWSYLEDKKFLKVLDIEDNNIDDEFLLIDESIDSYKSILLTEYKFFLSDMMLFKVDRTSMFHSVEVRSPFLDHKLIEYIFSHSLDYLDSTQPKKILKEYLANDFSNEFTNREKKGFVFDLENWIFNNKNIIFSQLIQGKVSQIINIEKLKKLLINKSRINSHRIWKILVLHFYLEELDFKVV